MSKAAQSQRWSLDQEPRTAEEDMAKRRRPGKNQPTDKEAVDPMMTTTTGDLESAAASLARAASNPETFFQANEGVAKVRCSIPRVPYTMPYPYACRYPGVLVKALLILRGDHYSIGIQV